MEVLNAARSYKLYDSFHYEDLRPRYLCLFLLFIGFLVPLRRIIQSLGWFLPMKFLLMVVTLPFMLLCAHYYKEAFMIIYVNSCDLMTILMPALIFHFTYNMDLQMIWKCKYQIMTNTIRSILEAVFLILLLRGLLNIGYKDSIFLGFIASIPLPLSILAYLENLGQYEYIAILLKMEAILLITVTDLVLLCTTSDYSFQDHVAYYLLFSCKHILAAIAIGIVHGKLIVWFLLQTQAESINVLVIILSNMYISYGLIAPQAEVSCDLTTFVVGLIISSDKTKYSQELDKLLSMFWDQIFEIIDTFVLLTVTCFFLWFFSFSEAYESHHYFVIVYLTSNILRFLTYLLFMPIMRRLGHGITFRSLIVLSLAGIKDSVNLIHLLRLYEYGPMDRIIYISLPLVFFSMMINASTMPFFLNYLGLSSISISRKTNMNSCMKFIMEKRTAFIAALKLNRYLSDADWKTIQDTTIIVHPYKMSMNENEDLGDLEVRFNYCPYCQKDFAMDLTKTERDAMIRESNLRLLKAKKISYIRQYENGMLSKDGITILLRAIELGAFTKAKSELELLPKLANRGSVLRFFAKYLMKLWSDQESNYGSPQIYCRKVAFYIVMHWFFDVVINATIVVVSIPAIIMLSVSSESMADYNFPLYILFTVGNLIFLAEFILKILGFSENNIKEGFHRYFSSWWNILDFLIVVIAYADQIIETIHLLQITHGTRVVRFLRMCRLFRIVRIVRVFHFLQPKLIHHLEANIDLKMALAFDIAKGMLVALEEIESQLPKIIEEDEIRTKVLVDLREVRDDVYKHLSRIAKERPWVSITVKTKQAIRTTLNAIGDAINELKFSGYIDIQEHAKLLKSWEESNKVTKRMRVIQRSLPKEIFKQVSWMAGDPDLTDFLFKRIEKKSFDTDAVVCYQNEMFEGVMVLITGIVGIRYVPSEVDHLQDLRDYGALPIVDFIASVQFDVSVKDYAVSGSSIGELCYLTKRYYCSTLTANAPTEAYLIPTAAMDEAMQKYNDPIFGLEAQLWKYVTFELMTRILMDTQVYATVPADQVKVLLERAFIPNIRTFGVLRMNDMIEDVILLEGLAADNVTKEMYIAPCYINRQVQQLNFYKTSTIHFDTKIQPVVMILPVKDADEFELMEKIEDYNELVGYESHSRTYTEAYTSKKRVISKVAHERKNGSLHLVQ